MPLTYREFLDQIATTADEIGGDKETRTGSHTYPPSLRAHVYDSEGKFLNSGTIEMVDVDQHLGCGCWVGIALKIKLEKD